MSPPAALQLRYGSYYALKSLGSWGDVEITHLMH